MPIIASEIQYRLSGGSANSDANTSLGGVKSSLAVPNQLFDDVSGDESAAGDIEYRCFYIHNANASLALQNAVVWIQANTTGNRIAVGLGSSGINGTEQTVANENTAPTSVTFSQPTSKGTGLSIGNLPAGQHKAVWLRRTITAGTAASNDTYIIRVEGDTAA